VDPVLLILWVVAGCAGSASWYFSETRRIKRRLRGAKAWPIGALPEDTLGRVIGRTCELDRVLTAPLTGRACVYYIAAIDEYDGNAWRKRVTECRAVAFVIEDGTGRAIVEPTSARVALVAAHTRKSDAPTAREEALLARHNPARLSVPGPRQLRVAEAVIAIGEQVAVLGSGIREPDPGGVAASAYRGLPPTRLRLTSSARHPLMISDDPTTTRRAGRRQR
jgi:hypothetical protein